MGWTEALAIRRTGFFELNGADLQPFDRNHLSQLVVRAPHCKNINHYFLVHALPEY
jgi:hypothetical protein